MMTISAVAVLAGAAFAAAPGERPPVRGGTIAVAKTSMGAEVVKVNEPLRVLHLQDVQGRRFSLRVPDDVAGLQGLEKGDEVDVLFLRGAALAFGTPETPPAEADSAVRLAPPDGSPVGGALDALNVEGTILEIDHGSRELVLSGDDGRLRLLQAVSGAPGFDEARAGDSVVARVTEAVALELEER